MKYKRKVAVVEAVQWQGNNFKEIMEFSNCSNLIREALDFNNKPYGLLYIETLEGRHIANIGDFIIKGIKGEFYPCKPEIFELIYEKVIE